MKLLILPGDGIGPDIAEATNTVLKALDERFGLGLELTERVVGLAAHAETGQTIPDEVFELCDQVDGVVLGPADTAVYPPPEQGGVNPSAEFRRRFDLFANICPSRSRAGTDAMADNMDLVIVRENTEGFYADRNMAVGSGEFMPTPDLALAVRKITREGSARIGLVAAQLAARRRGKLTIVTKSNVLKLSDGLFRDAVRDAAAAVPGLEIDEVHVDAMASYLVRTPEAFDVVVTTNMFGDILSNEAAEISGGLGLAASLNAGHERAVAQAGHGSAPDIAGQGKANPTALIQSAAMLLDWLGEHHQRSDLREAARAADAAVDQALRAASTRTIDLGGSLSTGEMGAVVAQAAKQVEV